MQIRTAAVYARVSLSDGSQDTENQLIQLREYCQRQGWAIEREYIDHVSGKRSDNRRQFKAMFTDASQRRFDVVLVWALDRFSREGVMETFDHIKRLTGYRVEFESFTEPQFRTTGACGELMIAIAAWIAMQERIRISERTKAGMDRARREGKQIGRPKKILNRDRVRQMHQQGVGMRAIGKQFGISAMSVSRIVAS